MKFQTKSYLFPSRRPRDRENQFIALNVYPVLLDEWGIADSEGNVFTAMGLKTEEAFERGLIAVEERDSQIVWGIYGELLDGTEEHVGDYDSFESACEIIEKILGIYKPNEEGK